MVCPWKAPFLPFLVALCTVCPVGRKGRRTPPLSVGQGFAGPGAYGTGGDMWPDLRYPTRPLDGVLPSCRLYPVYPKSHEPSVKLRGKWQPLETKIGPLPLAQNLCKPV